MISKQLLKIICVFSFMAGGLVGVIPLIPIFVWTAFFIIMFCTAPFMIIYLRKLGLINELQMEQTLIISAIAGATSSIGFTVIYFPIALILNLIFKIQSFMWIKVLFVNFGFLIPTMLLIAFLSAILNAFSGFLTVYLHNFFKRTK